MIGTLLLTTPVAAQKGNSNTNERLARQFYEQKDFANAIVYLDQLYKDSPEQWYGYYFNSLLAVKDYAKAEKVVKRQIRQNNNDVYLYEHLGRVYRLQGEEKKEKETYEKAIRELSPIQPFVLSLAAAFLEDGLYDYALRTYEKGRKATPEYPYFYERADIYKEKNDLVAMINEYLDALEFRESELQIVQMHLQNSLGYDDEQGGINNPLLSQELQKRIQKHPDKIVFSEFLIFILKQQKKFDAAFVQTRALDKRLKEDGVRVYDLAKICVSNGEWATARRCYDYLIEKGPDNLYYDASVLDGLHAEYMALVEKPQPAQADLLALELKLKAAWQKYARNFMNAQVTRDLALLQAYYLGKMDEAIALLDTFIGQAGLGAFQKAEYKLLLADIYMVKGEIWEASLLYSQVEKDFKYEPIGQDAKFKNAKLSFYAGDFAWAKTQADVLKGATSKLIANDALDLSLIITDAIGVDTNDVPLKMFASAELMVQQHRYADAIARMDSINLLFSSHTLGDDIFYKKAQIYMAQGKLSDAEAMYKSIVEYYPDDLYGDDAQFHLAELYDQGLNDKEKAKKAYEDVLIKYPGSIYSVEARKRFRALRGDHLNN